MRRSLSDIAALIGSEISPESGRITIEGVASLQDAAHADISFLSNTQYARYLETTEATAVIVPENVEVPDTIVPLVVADPYLAFLRVLEMFQRPVGA